LLRLSGPLATTSANRSGEAAATTAAEAAASFAAQQVPLLGPEPWPEPSGQASTVLGWHEGRWQLLRAGTLQV
jgi:L-threonylcarbamoyladenylate synthase